MLNIKEWVAYRDWEKSTRTGPLCVVAVLDIKYTNMDFSSSEKLYRCSRKAERLS